VRQRIGKKVSGTFCAQHPLGLPGKRYLTPFSARLLHGAVLGALLIAAAGCSTARDAAQGIEAGLGDFGQGLERQLNALGRRVYRLVEPPGEKFRRSLARLKTGTPDERRKAILYLDRKWEWSNDEARDAFVRILVNRVRFDEDELVRAVAARALRHYAQPTAVGALVAALADRDEYVRVEAARSLAVTADAEAVVALLRLLRSDASPQVRAAAAAALGAVRSGRAPHPDRNVLAALCEALDDRDFAVVCRSAGALVRLTGQDHGHSRTAWEAALRAPPANPR